jgi:Uma2 family endonuclease
MSNLAYKLDEMYTYADYLSWDTDERYEVVDGIAEAMASPSADHQRICRELMIKICDFLEDKPCEAFIAPFDVRLFPAKDNCDTTVVQPDILVVCDKSKLADGKACKGAPDLIIEILSKTSVMMDRKVKTEVYRDAGVKEYWIVDYDAREVLVNLLNNGRYESTVYEDIVPSSVLPGFSIDLNKVRAAIR